MLRCTHQQPCRACWPRGAAGRFASWGMARDSGRLVLAGSCHQSQWAQTYQTLALCRLALRLQSEVVNGPTRSHGLPAFRCGAYRASLSSFCCSARGMGGCAQVSGRRPCASCSLCMHLLATGRAFNPQAISLLKF